MPAGRPSKLTDPDYLQRVALCFYNGMSRQGMVTELGVKDVQTITRWRRDPRVKAIVGKLNEDRVLQISRKVDSVVEARLGRADELDTETLLRIRKEYGGGAVARTETDDATVAEAMSRLEEDPTFSEDLAAFIEGRAAAPAAKE